MTPELENLIRKRAHEIWEGEGRPHGRHEEHWRRAADEVAREVERLKTDHVPEPEGSEGAPAPRRARKAAPAGAGPAPGKAGAASAKAAAGGPEAAPKRARKPKAQPAPG